MKYSKIITAGILLLSFVYIDKMQNIIISKFEKFSSDKIVSGLSGMPLLEVNEAPMPSATVPVPEVIPLCQVKENTLEEEITGILKNVGLLLKVS